MGVEEVPNHEYYSAGCIAGCFKLDHLYCINLGETVFDDKFMSVDGDEYIKTAETPPFTNFEQNEAENESIIDIFDLGEAILERAIEDVNSLYPIREGHQLSTPDSYLHEQCEDYCSIEQCNGHARDAYTSANEGSGEGRTCTDGGIER